VTHVTHVLDPRPAITPALESLLEQVVALTPALRGLSVDAIVIVGLAAHGVSVASVRTLSDQAASVIVAGKRRTVELGLRPGFFLDGDAPSRLATLCHELLHLDPQRPHALREENRHARRSQTSLDAEAADVARAAIAGLPPSSVLCLAHEGEVRLRCWRHRPVRETRDRAFTDADVFDGLVRMHTPADRRGGWW
jgi:hypothetical protein